MLRPMTSGGSALSGIVAKGHQAIHFGSSAFAVIFFASHSDGWDFTIVEDRRMRFRP